MKFAHMTLNCDHKIWSSDYIKRLSVYYKKLGIEHIYNWIDPQADKKICLKSLLEEEKFSRTNETAKRTWNDGNSRFVVVEENQKGRKILFPDQIWKEKKTQMKSCHEG